ncbi:hypothetical protein NQ315_014542 [Exocentrus adspersus]|uniref:DDE Tnp4 domain-containing protein n=1 Tax=Exocentrus adspersus TaxID=1586481 RepID=A0AAV8VKN9_9CUCU|nr:hypothetical protein NQ315_014542 [Exocentrus adspersus]
MEEFSHIYAKLCNGLLPKEYHLLGDTAYPLDTFIIVPFKDTGHLSREQKKFNLRLSSTRVVIEQAFGRLKGIFRRLKYLNIITLAYFKFVVTASCVLHNIIIREKLLLDYEASEYCNEASPEPAAQTPAKAQVYPGHSKAKEPVTAQPLPQADVPPASQRTRTELTSQEVTNKYVSRGIAVVPGQGSL